MISIGYRANSQKKSRGAVPQEQDLNALISPINFCAGRHGLSNFIRRYLHSKNAFCFQQAI